MLWTAVRTAAARTPECTVAHAERLVGNVGVTEFAHPPSLRDPRTESPQAAVVPPSGTAGPVAQEAMTAAPAHTAAAPTLQEHANV